MLWIVVTSPYLVENEHVFIHRMLAAGVDFVHLRKPNANIDEICNLLRKLSHEDRSHIVIHDFFGLVQTYGLHGIHLNSRHGEPVIGYKGHISRSCHSLEEVVKYKSSCQYVFLSPIFDSVSKQGYTSTFTGNTLTRASEDGIIDGRVVALGGVTPGKIKYLKSLGFGGAAMLGYVYSLATLSEKEQYSALIAIRNSIKN